MRVPAAVSKIQGRVSSAEYRASHSKYVLAGIDRLVTRETAYPVWMGMPREHGLPSPLDFLSVCENALSAWERMPRAPDKEIEKDLAKLAADAESLAKRIDQHAVEIRFSGIPLSVANHLASLSPKRQHKYGRHRLPHLYDPDNAVGPVLIQTLLREFATRLKSPEEGSRHPLRPTKRRARDAERTFLVRNLVDFFLRNGGKPHWEWVALSVAAMTDGEQLDVRHIQRLVEDIHPLFSSPADELLYYSRLWDAEHDGDA